jgi:putative FmdB family regulatory protein
MPTYGYRCTACETTFERLQKITDPPITECVECGQPVKKILYPVGIAFKGSGFYVNDYAPSGGSSKKSGESSGGESAPAASTSSTETKSEPAPAATSTPAASDAK